MTTTITWSIAATLLLAVTTSAGAANASAVGKSSPAIVKMTPGMTVPSLAGRADSDVVEFATGQRLPVRDLRRLNAVGQKMRSAGAGRPIPPALAAKPAARGVPLRQRDDLMAALKRPDSDTIQLPSGKRLTVGQLRLLKPEIEKRLGRPLESIPARKTPTGPATKLQRGMGKSEWKALLQKPDTTILESPNGKRITVGELKQVMTLGRTSVERQPAMKMGGRP